MPDWSYVIAGLDPAISPAKEIPASERGNDIVSYKSKLGYINTVMHTLSYKYCHAEPDSSSIACCHAELDSSSIGCCHAELDSASLIQRDSGSGPE